MRKRLLLNTMSNYGVFLLRVIVAFVMTPLYVEYMGLVDYGLWEIVISIIGYAGLLDLGLWPTVSRFAAKYAAEENTDLQEKTFATAILFLSTTGILAAFLTAGLVVSFEWALFFGGGEQSRSYQIFLVLVLLQVIVKFPSIVVEAYLEGQQRYVAKNLFSIVNIVTASSVLFALIDSVNGLMLLSVVSLVGMLIKFAVYYLLVFRFEGQQFRFRVSQFSISHLKTLLRFGAKSFVQGLSSKLTSRSSPVIIGAMGSTALVPLFTVPASLINYANTLLMTSTHVFMPYFSDKVSKNDMADVVTTFTLVSRVVCAVAVLVALGICLVGGKFVSLWINPEFGVAAEKILVFLVFTMSTLILNPLGSRFMTAIDKHGVFAIYGPIFSAVGVLLGLILFPSYGISGLAFASGLSAFLVAPILLRYTCLQLDLPIPAYMKAVFSPAVFSGLAALVSYMALRKSAGVVVSVGGLLVDVMLITGIFLASFCFIDFCLARQSAIRVFVRR